MDTGIGFVLFVVVPIIALTGVIIAAIIFKRMIVEFVSSVKSDIDALNNNLVLLTQVETLIADAVVPEETTETDAQGQELENTGGKTAKGQIKKGSSETKATSDKVNDKKKRTRKPRKTKQIDAGAPETQNDE